MSRSSAPSIRRRGGRSAAFAAVVLLGACGYSFRSPVPAHLQTVYVPTFQNDTQEFQITQLLTEQVIDEFLNESRLRLVGSEDDADLVVSGTIVDYDEEALSYDPGQAANPDVFSRRVILTVDLIVADQVKDETLWENPNLSMWGEFSEEQGEDVQTGILRAVEKIADEVLRHVVEEF